MATALVWALYPCQLAVEPSPAGAAETFSIDTNSMAGACWVQTIHWKKEGESMVSWEM